MAGAADGAGGGAGREGGTEGRRDGGDGGDGAGLVCNSLDHCCGNVVELADV